MAECEFGRLTALRKQQAETKSVMPDSHNALLKNWLK